MRWEAFYTHIVLAWNVNEEPKLPMYRVMGLPITLYTKTGVGNMPTPVVFLSLYDYPRR